MKYIITIINSKYCRFYLPASVILVTIGHRPIITVVHLELENHPESPNYVK